ncbi:DUF3302 domain-containing protein [Pseudomonadota bacterium]|uniref:DUF3302 domain-containing protein n=1 Tax=unclassified Shewanella TaxID=196818 RepID=UPI000CBAA218|nr:MULTISPECIES: DUF3302 domain-containing protein [unclassified Shewanella]MDO6619199.1 DUF3302 domain-containing protein [Shewanella sp. 6_MG-2023]MDO6638875.1 DUF3302 domain-containing protein [Shewanella sp. 5_MG-2023]MDO6677231.1 DUF3302 domain-containing protein [Shewanella sp. 4_MG-2023]MDO6773893.1 DUF3302 domain-containing protein [Shewanella sp. 3_MG-2023]PMG31592.1 GTPase [Shewanella sp. 10N.286.52.C2]
MFLDYFALGLLFFVALVIFYGVIAIHDIPYEIAKKRNHPQQDALHIAGWVSLFTLHAIWPFLWIWATLYREDRGWGFSDGKKRELMLEGEVKELLDKVNDLNERLISIESPSEQASVTDAVKPQPQPEQGA